MSISVLSKVRLSERISIAIFVAGMSFAAQAEHCVQGTLCYPDPADVCGPTGPLWCAGNDENGNPQMPFSILIPHMRDNPYPVTCGVSDRAQMLRSLAFDMLAFARENNNYSEWYGAAPSYQINLNDMGFELQYSDGSFVHLYGGGSLAPGQYDPAVLANPLGSYGLPPGSSYYWPAEIAPLWLGPDATGHVFKTTHIGYVSYLDPNPPVPPLCIKF